MEASCPKGLLLELKKGRVEPLVTSGRGRGRRAEYKVHLGWQHYNRKAFRVVTNAKGGGSRTISCKAEQQITVEQIIEQGEKMLFKDGKSYFGELSSMSVTLTDSRGEEVSQFTNLNGEPCSYTEYLTSNGLYPSQCHLYLRTKVLETPQDNKNESKGQTFVSHPQNHIWSIMNQWAL